MCEEFCWCKTTERVKFIATKSQGCAYDQQHHTKGLPFHLFGSPSGIKCPT